MKNTIAFMNNKVKKQLRFSLYDLV